MKCPMCDTPNLKIESVDKKATISSGDKFSYTDKVYCCSSCGFEGPVRGSLPKDFKAKQKLAIKDAIKNIVGELHKKFANLLYVERALKLPRRTLSRLKNTGQGSAPTLLLLKMIETFPFLVDVAERKFDKQYAIKALKDAALSASYLELPIRNYKTSWPGSNPNPDAMYYVDGSDFPAPNGFVIKIPERRETNET